MPVGPEGEGREQVVGSPLENPEQIQAAPNRAGIGLEIPRRKLSHADPNWYQCDLDQQFDDPDEEQLDPMPTERYFHVP